MIRSKYGADMTATDKHILDDIIDDVLAETSDYGEVLESVIAIIEQGTYSKALKYNVLNKTSWFLKHLDTAVQLHA